MLPITPSGEVVVEVAKGIAYVPVVGVWRSRRKGAHPGAIQPKAKSGSVCVNRYRALAFNFVFGSHKASGVGSETVDEFLAKSIRCELEV